MVSRFVLFLFMRIWLLRYECKCVTEGGIYELVAGIAYPKGGISHYLKLQCCARGLAEHPRALKLALRANGELKLAEIYHIVLPQGEISALLVVYRRCTGRFSKYVSEYVTVPRTLGI